MPKSSVGASPSTRTMVLFSPVADVVTPHVELLSEPVAEALRFVRVHPPTPETTNEKGCTTELRSSAPQRGRDDLPHDALSVDRVDERFNVGREQVSGSSFEGH